MADDREQRTRSPVLVRAGQVRVRTTVAAVLVVGAALAVAAVVMVVVLRATLTRDVRHAVDLRADEVVTSLEAGQGPAPLAVSEKDEELVQVLDTDGRVVASSPNVAGLAPVTNLRPPGSARISTPINDHDEFMAVAKTARTKTGRLTVIVSRALSDVSESAQVVTRLLIIGIPVLMMLVAVIVWRVVGRALAPVEAIRREVDGISAAELHRRVTGPSGDDEIARLAATMNRMLARLEDGQTQQRRFVSDASHELRSPVTSIRQHAEVALAHPSRTTTVELARTVLAEEQRVQRLIEDLLLLARADEHTIAPNRQPLDLDDVVFDEARRLREVTDLRIDTAGVSAGRISAHAPAVRRVVGNLADNAARHARGCVRFALAERRGSIVLTIDDDGPGIPLHERQRVFERFVRLDDARARDDGGSGLGLAIVTELVSAHGGSVVIGDTGSDGLGGARLQVTFPACAGR